MLKIFAQNSGKNIAITKAATMIICKMKNNTLTTPGPYKYKMPNRAQLANAPYGSTYPTIIAITFAGIKDTTASGRYNNKSEAKVTKQHIYNIKYNAFFIHKLLLLVTYYNFLKNMSIFFYIFFIKIVSKLTF